jgi:hypothetical protein
MPYAESDLVHNRVGNLSPAQKARLSRSWRRMSNLGGGFMVFMLGLGVVFHFAGDQGGLVCAWIFAGMIGLGLLWIGRTVRRVQLDGMVATIRGTVQRQTAEEEGSARYYLLVSGQRLAMDEADYPNFDDGRVYRVYYVPSTGYVVSAEADQA